MFKIKNLYFKLKYRIQYRKERGFNIAKYYTNLGYIENTKEIDENDKNFEIKNNFKNIMTKLDYVVFDKNKEINYKNIFYKLDNIMSRCKENNYIQGEIDAESVNKEIHFNLTILKSSKKACKFFEAEKSMYDDLYNMVKCINEQNKFIVYIDKEENIDREINDDESSLYVDYPIINIVLLKDNLVLTGQAPTTMEKEILNTAKKLGFNV
ncbi:hypothetical protein [Anaerofustis butyriciformans]|uniref:hypothetical protein n=1 Tax=Anaerofustis butyriciformans TaxID=3108533 RepID=UPI003F8C0BB7